MDIWPVYVQSIGVFSTRITSSSLIPLRSRNPHRTISLLLTTRPVDLDSPSVISVSHTRSSSFME